MANATENRINTVITDADVTAIGTGFTGINTKLDPYTVALTDDERSSLFSMAEENRVFAEAALEQGNLLFDSLPPAMQAIVTNMAKDLGLFKQLEKMENTQIKPLALSVADTKRLSAHEGYVGALALYKIIEAFAQMGIPGFQAAFDALKERFAGQGGRPPAPDA